jgi:hypothetical protein
MKKFSQYVELRNENIGIPGMSSSRAALATRGLGGTASLKRINTGTEKTHREGNPQQSAAAVEQLVLNILNGNDLPSQLAVIKTLKRLMSKISPAMLMKADAAQDDGSEVNV